MQPNSFLLISRKMLHAYNKMCEPLLAEYGIPQVSFDILMFLANNPQFSTAKEICEIRHIKKNLVSVHVDKLVSAGLLQRNSVTGDRRKIALFPTEKAEPIIKAGHDMQNIFFSIISSGIDEDMWLVFDKINRTIETNAENILKN